MDLRTLNVLSFLSGVIVLMATDWLHLPQSLKLISLFLFLLGITAMVLGSMRISSNFFINAFCKGSKKKNEIAISFDDGPDAVHTPVILDILQKYNVPAAFFVIGNRIQGNENIIRRIIAEGHTIGNHSWSHGNMIDFKLSKGWREELQSTNKLVQQITGLRPALFRPPYGVTTPHIAKAVRAEEMLVAGWSVRSLDTTKDSADTIYKRVESQMAPGSMILFHDTSLKTAQLLEKTIELAANRGFKIVSAGQLFNIPEYKENLK